MENNLNNVMNVNYFWINLFFFNDYCQACGGPIKSNLTYVHIHRVNYYNLCC